MMSALCDSPIRSADDPKCLVLSAQSSPSNDFSALSTEHFPPPVATLSDILQAEDITPLANLQLFARTVMEGFTTGQHASPHKGFSVEFAEHRPYMPGDDLRYLDWRIAGRADRWVVKPGDVLQTGSLRITFVAADGQVLDSIVVRPLRDPR